MEQMTLIVVMVALIFFAEKTGVGIYKILAGLISFALALTVVSNTIIMVVFLGLALYLIVSVFTSTTK